MTFCFKESTTNNKSFRSTASSCPDRPEALLVDLYTFVDLHQRFVWSNNLTCPTGIDGQLITAHKEPRNCPHWRSVFSSVFKERSLVALDARQPVVTDHHCPVMPPRERPTGQELGAFRTANLLKRCGATIAENHPSHQPRVHKNLIFPKYLLGLRDTPPTFGVPDRDLRREI